MRRTASEIINTLESRIAKLEKSSASVSSLSAQDASKYYIEVINDIENRLEILEDIGYVRSFEGKGHVEALTAQLGKIYRTRVESELDILKEMLEYIR